MPSFTWRHDTTATDGDLVLGTNASRLLLDWCTATRTPFIYASCRDPWRLWTVSTTTGRRRCAGSPMNSMASASICSILPWPSGSPTKLLPHAGLTLQRVRPERISQGRDDEPVAKRGSSAAASRCVCSSRTATASATASRSAISSSSRTPLPMRWLLDTPSVSGISMSAPARRSFRDLIAPCSARWPRAEYRLCRHADGDPRAVSIFHAS